MVTGRLDPLDEALRCYRLLTDRERVAFHALVVALLAAEQAAAQPIEGRP